MLARKEDVGMKKRSEEAAQPDWVNVCSKVRHSVTFTNGGFLLIAQNSPAAVIDYYVSFSSDDTESTCSSSTQEPIAPDGGYGWVIVLASFLIHFICDGISFSFGIMFSEIQEYFNVTKTMSGVVGSIFLSVPLLSGPLAGALTDIYDCRRMTIVGGLLAASGGLMSFFAFNIWHFLFLFAFITGIGLSFCFNTAIVAVTYYFQKKRAIATGIAVCGSGAGTFVLAPFIEMDLEWPHDSIEYKKKKFIEKTEREKLQLAIRNAGDTSSVFTMDFTHIGSTPRRAISLPSIPTYAVPVLQIIDQCSNLQSVRTTVNELQIPISKSYSMGEFLPASTIPREHPYTFDVNRGWHVSRLYNVDISGGPCRRHVWSKESCYVGAGDSAVNEASEADINFSGRMFRTSSGDSLDDVVNSRQIRLIHAKLERTPSCNLTQENSTRQPLLDNDTRRGKPEAVKISEDIIPSFANRTVRNSYIATSLGAAQGRVPATNVLNFRWKFVSFGDGMFRRIPSAPAICYRRKRKRTIQLNKMWESFMEWISNMKVVLIVPEFSVFLLSTFILYIFFDIPYVNFPEYAVENHNVTETEASYLVSGIGLTNMVSMLFCGIIADWNRTSQYIIQMYGIFITLAGLCVMLAPFATSYVHLMVLCIGFGFFISANYTLASVITLQVLCLYDFQTGYGILCLVEGFIRDNLSSYDNIFLLAGAGTMISGLMVVAIDIFMRASDTGHEKKNSVKRDKHLGDRMDYIQKVEDGEVCDVCHHFAKIPLEEKIEEVKTLSLQ
uniref:Major facilitator superfamily (MFS) profile domain-containing protein n=1 Tax=Setaria digitata TaxID=48799 RepID=A0A915PMG7_9BILA